MSSAQDAFRSTLTPRKVDARCEPVYSLAVIRRVNLHVSLAHPASLVKDQLYILKPNFEEGGIQQFCVDCATVEGMLSFYPELRQHVDVKYVAFQRPRTEIVAELGPDNQSSPVLIVNQNVAGGIAGIQEYQGRRFLNEPHLICDYLARTYRTGIPRT